MIASIKTTAHLEMDEYELEIFSRLLDKLKNGSIKMGFKRDVYDDEEAAMIDGLCEWCGIPAEDQKEAVLASNTVIE